MVEIERKFLVSGNFMRDVYAERHIVQGYLCSVKGRTVRVRIRDEAGFLTIKGPTDAKGMSRYEFEQAIPLEDAEKLLERIGIRRRGVRTPRVARTGSDGRPPLLQFLAHETSLHGMERYLINP